MRVIFGRRWSAGPHALSACTRNLTCRVRGTDKASGFPCEVPRKVDPFTTRKVRGEEIGMEVHRYMVDIMVATKLIHCYFEEIKDLVNPTLACMSLALKRIRYTSSQGRIEL